MPYHQITTEERYTLGLLRERGMRPAAIARVLGRDRSTVGRELHRNRGPLECETYDPLRADAAARRRRIHARRPTRFTPADWACIATLVCADWSPEQIAGRLRRRRQLAISSETIYRYIWQDQRAGGQLYTHLRGASKQRRKRYGAPDSRGRLAGKRPITARPAGAAHRSRFGHWEGDTMLGAGHGGPCVLTLVERKSGFLAIGQLPHHASADVNRRARALIAAQPRPVRTITVDNGGEFHGYAALERVVDARFYFATPHHASERGSNENANGLLRQYLPKGASMAHLTQDRCNQLATKLNRRPRKRWQYRTPEECYVP
jgi:transposase, IS30 family